MVNKSLFLFLFTSSTLFSAACDELQMLTSQKYNRCIERGDDEIEDRERLIAFRKQQAMVRYVKAKADWDEAQAAREEKIKKGEEVEEIEEKEPVPPSFEEPIGLEKGLNTTRHYKSIRECKMEWAREHNCELNEYGDNFK